MLIREYMRIAAKTDQLEPKTSTHSNFKVMPILGLAGEIGSLLTELKKRVREPNRADDLGLKLIKEELGDIIWYSAAIARRAQLDFQSDVLLGNLRRIGENLPNYLPASGQRRKAAIAIIKGVSIVRTFDAYQKVAAKSAISARNADSLIPYLSRIWLNSGELLDRIDVARAQFNNKERGQVSHSLGDVMWYVAGFATLFKTSLSEIASLNATKAQSMFAPGKPTPLHDETDKLLEQFPRRFNVDFVSTNSETAVMLINGMQIGDPLRDNAELSEQDDGVIDGYRFHDSVHLAFVAVLGWSPVVRSLMKRKRKSKKKVDDSQDGARAQIVEEMVVKLAHSYAVGVDRRHLLNGRTHVTMDLLKQIQLLTEGLEVSSNKLWEWDKAIIEGYKIFDQLRRNGCGRIIVDLQNRSVSFSKIESRTAEVFPRPRA